MKKYIVCLGLLFSPFLWGFSQADLTALLQKPQSIQGDFTQQRFLKSLPKPIVVTGQFTLVSQKGLLWQMQTPFASQMKVTPQGIFQWNGEQWVNNGQIGQAEQVRLFLGLLSGDISGLSSQFDIQLQGSASQWTLQFTPSSLLMKQIFERIDIRGNQVVTEIELTEKQGDRTLIQLTQHQLDRPLSAFAQSVFTR